MALKTLVIIPAGEEKIWDWDTNLDKNRHVRAKDAYTGRLAERCREYCEIFYEEDYVILSPRFGFLLPNEEIPDYSAKTFAESGLEYDTIEINAESDGLLNYERVVFLGSQKLHTEYIDVVSKLFSDKWVEFPLLDSENTEAMLGRLIDAITRDSPLRFNRIKLEYIDIKGLFSKFNHKIPLENGEHISIVTAPNGYGKTTILRLLRAVFVGNIKEIRDIPFSSAEIGFYTEEENSTERRVLTIEKSQDKPKGRKLPGKEMWSLHFKTCSAGKTLEYTVNPDNYSEDETSWELSRIIPPIPVKFISAQRLWQNSESGEKREDDLLTSHIPGAKRTYELTILNHSDDIKKRIQAMLNDYAASTQQLDATYPSRYMKLCYEMAEGLLPPAETIIQSLSNIRLEQKKLKKLGFLSHEPAKGEIFEIDEDEIKDETGVLAALTLYIEDTEKKYLIFSDLEKKIDLLIRIINALFLNLSFEIRADRGFYFTVGDSERIKPERLSSGEQNQLVMYYDLIFFTDPGTLVLIDEPEISLHIVWQRQYLDYIKKITDITGSEFIIATHSPQLIHTNWDYTVDLSEGHGDD
ncbi:AAA family ATPase [Methanoplanus limicola]|uniref:ATP-binding protein involved in virulence n=1 Tax=Methanoplanus limicola DSM 2279 TaxID=937775 RepID=H1Z2M5_9EURY|nr:AAA family ATPase [Methanoplanus limicola]EHQ36428.1 ATP-binding protein involved in virulence [Methanoplanus limicola DSM 2279]